MNKPLLPASGTFAGDRHACEHLCDHVLTRPEAHDWSLILPGYPALVLATDDARLTAIASSLFSPSPTEKGVELLQRYLAALRQAVADALRLDWWWGQSEGNYVEWHGLGLSGVYVIWDNRVFKTGFLHRSAEYPPAAPLYDRLNNPLPRRRYEKRLSAVPADTEDERYLLFHENLLLVQKVYENACDRNAVHAWGSKVFVTRPPRMGKWTQLLAGSPAPLDPRSHHDDRPHRQA